MTDHEQDLFIVVDIGCIECGETSKVVGVFTSEDDAHALRDTWRKAGWRGGQHDYTVFVVPASRIDTVLFAPEGVDG